MMADMMMSMIAGTGRRDDALRDRLGEKVREGIGYLGGEGY